MKEIRKSAGLAIDIFIRPAALPITLILLIVFLPPLPRYIWTRIDNVDQDFKGIFASEKITETLGRVGDIRREKTIHLLTVHGIGQHCIGYADDLVEGIAGYGKFERRVNERRLIEDNNRWGCVDNISDPSTFEYLQTSLCQEIRKQKHDDRDCQYLRFYADRMLPNGKKRVSKFPPGFIRTQNYRYQESEHGSTKLRHYELTWDTATRWAKHYYVDDHDSEFDNDRDMVNSTLKRQLINASIADAVMYLGDYRPIMLYPVLMAICKILSDDSNEEQENQEEFVCDFDKVVAKTKDNIEFVKNNEIVIIAHSLGTRMIFDALGMSTDWNFLRELKTNLSKVGVRFRSKNFPQTASDRVKDIKSVREVFRQSVRSIFALANQVPLLELGLIKTPIDYRSKPDLGDRFVKFVRDHSIQDKGMTPLQLVAVTDPNDLLSYNLKCWYFHHVLKRQDHEIRSRMEDTDLHGKYFDNCSNSKRNNEPKSIKVIQEQIWKGDQKFVRITDVTVNLSGLGYPNLVIHPATAHTRLLKDSMIHKLIACGAKQNAKKPENCF